MKQLAQIIILLNLISLSASANELIKPPTYKSEEFNNPDSRIPSMYQCAVLGVRSSYAPDAIVILALVNKKNNLFNAKKSGELLSDAFLWWDYEKNNFFKEDERLQSYWKNFCEIPISNMRNIAKH